MGSRRTWAMSLPVVAMLLLLGACTRPDLVDDDAIDGLNELRWRPAEEATVCDGTERKAGTIEQADGGETIEFTTALPIDVSAGRADDEGNYPLTWTCGPEEAQLRWDLTATGAASGRTVALTVVGAPVPADEQPIATNLFVDTVVCDGTGKDVGVIDGLAPGETVRFEADQDGASANPNADRTGQLAFAWRCRPADVDQTWEVTVRAVDSDRSTSFRLTGSPAAEDPALDVESAATAITCDGQIKPLATVINLLPFEPVTFRVTPPATNLRNGSADGNGRLDVQWQCVSDDVGKTWDLTAEGSETGKTIDLRFAGVAGAVAPPATVRLIEDPFICDGERRPVAELTGLDTGEFVDFTSPQADLLREGRATDGTLEVNWQCDPTDLDGADPKVWQLTATGRQSGRSVTFDIVGANTS